jgi:hypothetical protein
MTKTRMTIATAALYQSRAMKVALMAEQGPFGNDEASNRLFRPGGVVVQKPASLRRHIIWASEPEPR